MIFLAPEVYQTKIHELFLKVQQQIVTYLPEAEVEHISESICMLVTHEYAEDVAIQLIEKGSEYEMFVQFRDILNTRPEFVAQYNQLKLQNTGINGDVYRKNKSIYIAF